MAGISVRVRIRVRDGVRMGLTIYCNTDIPHGRNTAIPDDRS